MKGKEKIDIIMVHADDGKDIETRILQIGNHKCCHCNPAVQTFQC